MRGLNLARSPGAAYGAAGSGSAIVMLQDADRLACCRSYFRKARARVRDGQHTRICAAEDQPGREPAVPALRAASLRGHGGPVAPGFLRPKQRQVGGLNQLFHPFHLGRQ